MAREVVAAEVVQMGLAAVEMKLGQVAPGRVAAATALEAAATVLVAVATAVEVVATALEVVALALVAAATARLVATGMLGPLTAAGVLAGCWATETAEAAEEAAATMQRSCRRRAAPRTPSTPLGCSRG